MSQLNCVYCGKPFTTTHPKAQRFCSRDCWIKSSRKYERAEIEKCFIGITGEEIKDGFGDRICGIYRIKNNINNKVYIGQSIDIGRRIRQHIVDAKKMGDRKTNRPLYRAIRKYSIENFTFEIIHICSQGVLQFELDALEIQYINSHKSYMSAHGYNATKGGSGIDLNSEAYNKMLVENTRPEKLAKFEAGKLRYAKIRHEQSLERKRIKQEERQKQKTKRKPGRNYRKTRAVVCNELVCSFDSITDAGLFIGVRASSIWSCCNGKQSSINGLHFQWIDKSIPFVPKPRKEITFNDRLELMNKAVREGITRRVICVESNEVYGSAAIAANSIGVSANTMRGHLYKNQRTGKVKGKHFEFIA